MLFSFFFKRSSTPIVLDPSKIIVNTLQHSSTCIIFIKKCQTPDKSRQTLPNLNDIRQIIWRNDCSPTFFRFGAMQKSANLVDLEKLNATRTNQQNIISKIGFDSVENKFSQVCYFVICSSKISGCEQYMTRSLFTSQCNVQPALRVIDMFA